METRNLAIMLTDIKGFTAKTAGFSRAQTEALLERHSALVLPVVKKLGGRVVKSIGDAFLVVFNSPTEAVLCGVEIQDALRGHNKGRTPGEKIEVRIAINAGDVNVHDDGDIFGDPVNITSRLESIAEPGEVFFTEAVYLAMNKKEVPSSEIGYRQFKGVTDKVKVFRVLREVPVGAQPPAEAPQASTEDIKPAPAGFWRRLGALAADLAIVLGTLVALGLASVSGGVATVGEPPAITAMRLKGVSVGANGLEMKGREGEKATFNRTETVVTDGSGKSFVASNDVRFLGDRRKAPIILVIWAAYCALLTWRFGGTPGMKIFKLRAVYHRTGGPLPADRVFLRAGFAVISALLALGYIWALWEKDRRTWHDLVAGSRIMKG